jgi:3-oxoacyl-[acyl-carrier protein] reductase
VDITGKTVVVTGAGRGIGRAIAEHFASRGAHLALLDLGADDLAATRAACERHGITARTSITNVAVEGEVIAAMDTVARDFGRIDVLINNAGIIRDGLLVKTTLDQWRAVIDVNLTGVFLCGREAAKHMIAFGAGGVIVNISSISRHGNAGQSNYAAAKAGVAALTVTWAKELARHRIRVATVSPGFTRTDLVSAMRPDMLSRMTDQIPLGRLGEPGEIARAAEFAVANEFFSGRSIDLDGGHRI